jgi:hypothetical protein
MGSEGLGLWGLGVWDLGYVSWSLCLGIWRSGGLGFWEPRWTRVLGVCGSRSPIFVCMSDQRGIPTELFPFFFSLYSLW